MGTNTTRTRRLAELILGQPLGEWVVQRRTGEDGKRRSWRMVADDLREATNGEVNVAPETMRLWGMEFGADQPEDGAA